MRVGLKSNLRLVSLVPILMVFLISSYFLYNSIENFRDATSLQSKLTANQRLNILLNSITHERGLSILYLGDKSQRTLQLLQKQRKTVDQRIKVYFRDIEKECPSCSDTTKLKNAIDEIVAVRPSIDKDLITFEDMYDKVYAKIQKLALKHIEHIGDHQEDPQINGFASAYISFIKAREFTTSERDFINYAISRSLQLNENELNRWVQLISKADMFFYDIVHRSSLKNALNQIFTNANSMKLFADINLQRASLLVATNMGEYHLSVHKWYQLQTEKTNLLSEAQNLTLSAMQHRALVNEISAIQLLLITVTAWIVSILMALVGYFLLKGVERNIKTLEELLIRVAEDTTRHDANTINLDTPEGTSEAYKLLEEIIEQARFDKLAAQEASEAKSMFLANMSHEIRTPLNGIVGFTELLKDTGMNEEQQEFVDIIEKSSENLLEIINNILDISKIESNKIEIDQIRFNPLKSFEEAVEVYAVRAGEKHINFGCFIDPQLDLTLLGDPTKLREVLINLLSNSVKFTSTSGTITVVIKKLPCDTDGYSRIYFEVTDNGIGVTEEQKQRIFEAFSQADPSITRKYGGTGLGLTISTKFIELMGGKLDLESEVNKGTKFFFSLDLKESENVNKNSTNSFSDLNILVQHSLQKQKKQDQFIENYLQSFDIEYTTFNTLDELETLSESDRYDLLLIDYDYLTKEELPTLKKRSEKIVMLTRSNYLREIDSLGLNILKVLYEPIFATKLKQVLENYSTGEDKMLDTTADTQQTIVDSQKFDAKILVAEDNEINQKLIKRTLEDFGLTVEVASDGLEAFDKRKSTNYDMIFMDIQMPRLDGVESTKEIIKYEQSTKESHIPIIALTANALKGDRERFLEAGFDEYTTKPIIRAEIIKLLTHYLPNKLASVQDGESSKDILVGHTNKFSSKLIDKILNKLPVTYDMVQNSQELNQKLSNTNYKALFLDTQLQSELPTETGLPVYPLEGTITKEKITTLLADI